MHGLDLAGRRFQRKKLLTCTCDKEPVRCKCRVPYKTLRELTLPSRCAACRIECLNDAARRNRDYRAVYQMNNVALGRRQFHRPLCQTRLAGYRSERADLRPVFLARDGYDKHTVVCDQKIRGHFAAKIRRPELL